MRSIPRRLAASSALCRRCARVTVRQETGHYHKRRMWWPTNRNSLGTYSLWEAAVQDASVDRMAEPAGNPRVLWISSLAFTLGFAVWGMFSALAPFLIKWYSFSVAQVLLLAAMEPLFA